MNIVIAGAGEVGFHLATLLTIENKNITLVDLDEEVLRHADNYLDVLTVQGDVSSLEVLRRAKVDQAHLFIAATTSESTNLLAAGLAKKLGAKKTIARVSKVEYIEEDAKKIFHEMGIDNLSSPRILAALEIERLMNHGAVTDFLEFEKGLISIIGFTIDKDSKLINKTCEGLCDQTPSFSLKVICVLRDGKTIIPDKDMTIEKNDHIYLSSNNKDFTELNNYIRKPKQKIKKIMIIGGTPLALQTAQILEDKFAITMVVRKESRCMEILSKVNNALVINGNWGNIDLLKEEGLERMDALIALTDNSETNMITCITADQIGVYKTIALVDNAAYIHISQSIGVDTLINKKIIAANDIFKYIRKGKIEAIASMHGVNGEIIEFEIQAKNKVCNRPISQLHLPKNAAKIVGVVRNNEGIIPDEDFQLKVGDKVVIFALSEVIKKVERIF